MRLNPLPLILVKMKILKKNCEVIAFMEYHRTQNLLENFSRDEYYKLFIKIFVVVESELETS